MAKIFLTGVTGLVGSAFAAAVLSTHPDYRIVTLTRRNAVSSARERIERVIREQCDFDNISGAADDVLARMDVIEGDLMTTTAEELAAHECMKGVSIVFHCAADVNLGKDADKKTYNINYQGTAKMLALTKLLNVKEFHYVSTAYVAGKIIGVAKEDVLVNSGFNNSYENSKFDAENMVRNSGLKFSIYRPSIIVGRLSDGMVRRPLAFYRVLEFMAKLKKHHCAKNKINPLDWIEMDLRFETFPSEAVYFVPIDYVQNSIFALFFKPVGNKTYHITGSRPVSVHDIAKTISNTLRIKGVRVMEKVENPTADEKLVTRFLGDLLPYYSSRITFDQTNIREAMGEEFISWKFDDEHLDILMKAFLRTFFPNVEWLQQL